MSTFSEVGPSKKVDQYKISFQTMYNTLSFRAKKKKKKKKKADVSSHVTL